jgi:hypothetical protein
MCKKQVRTSFVLRWYWKTEAGCSGVFPGVVRFLKTEHAYNFAVFKNRASPRFLRTELGFCTQENCMGGTKEIKGVKKDAPLIYN